jgi:hypothetical protein
MLNRLAARRINARLQRSILGNVFFQEEREQDAKVDFLGYAVLQNVSERV